MGLLVCAPVFADDNDEEKGAASGNAEAKKRFAEGKDRYARGDYDGAVEAFKAAIAADPKLPGSYRDLGLAYRALGRCADALPNYEKYLELRPESRYTERVRREIDICRAKLGQPPLPPPANPPPRVTGTAREPEAQAFLHIAANLIGGEATDEAMVKVDGIVRGPTPLTVPITSGLHKVHLERPGFESADTTVQIVPGERREVELTMNKLASSPTPVVIETEPRPTGPRASWRKYGWALVGVASALALVGGGFGIAESNLHRDAVADEPRTTTRATVDALHDTGRTYSAIAYAGLAGGGAALAAAVIVFGLDPSRGETHARQKYVLAPLVSPTGAGLSATVRF
jgi:tetratricopeptide (TPR) repeat protein